MWRQAISRSYLIAGSISGSMVAYGMSSTVKSESSPSGNRYNMYTPGVYAWGINKGKIISTQEAPAIKNPTRIPFFDGKLLRDLCLMENVGLAVLENGDVVQWGADTAQTPQVVLKGKNINKIKHSNGFAYGIAKKGTEVFQVDLSTGKTSSLPLPNASWFESISDIQTGKDHLLVLTSNGRVLTSSTGAKAPQKSRGQFGIPSMSQFDPAPEPGVLHEITMLESAAEQIAAGDYHSVVLKKGGNQVQTFGENIYGQCGIPFSHRKANVGIPTPVKYEQLYNSVLDSPTVKRVIAGSNVTFMAVDSKNLEKTEPDTRYYAFGNGLTGHLGTGAWVHAQSSPMKMKHLNEMMEYNESLAAMSQIRVDEWQVGSTHAVITQQSASRSASAEYGQDVLVWGGNEFSQLGTGKRNNVPKPMSILPLDVDRDDSEQAEMGARMQLLKNRKFKFTTPEGKSRSVKAEQVIHAGDRCTAVYYRKV